MFVRSAAGFIATSTLGRSPGVRMSWSAKWIWKPETPGSEPAGARLSGGKAGSVDRSLPSTAVSLVKCAPVSCMPSPESPAKRIVTWLMRSTVLATGSRYSARPNAADWPRLRFGRGLADRRRLLRVVQLRGDLPVPDGRRDRRRPFHLRHLLRRPLVARPPPPGARHPPGRG